MATITFQAQNITILSDINKSILEIALSQGITMDYGCGAIGCGTCLVEIFGDCILSEPSTREIKVLSEMDNLPHMKEKTGILRLACAVRVLEGKALI